MKTIIKNREFSKSLKYFNPHPGDDRKVDCYESVRSSVEQKIDLLKTPVYQRKKALKKSISISGTNFQKPKTACNKIAQAMTGNLRQNQNQLKGHYRYRSTHRKKSYHSWFRKTSGNLQDTKIRKNVVDIVVLQKQIEKDVMPQFDKNSLIINLREKNSKSLGGNQDSQSLLRKNSLYLLNFIKRKQQSKKEQEPHIGGIPNLAQNMRITYSPTKVFKYVPTKNEAKKKQQRMIPTFSKMIGNFPIDPW